MEENTTSPVIAGETTPNEAPQEGSKKSNTKTIVAFLLGILVAVGGYIGYQEFSVEAVAIVNGEKITKAELEETVTMMVEGAALQGIDTTDETIAKEIRTQALANLVNNELLMGAAREKGMSANEAAVQSAYESLIAEVGGEDVLKTRMEEVGLTSETLMGNISDRLMVDAYLEEVTDIEISTVTEEEFTAYVTAMKESGVTLPPLEEVRPQIEASIVAERQQRIVNEHIETLRTEATIEIIEG